MSFWAGHLMKLNEVQKRGKPQVGESAQPPNDVWLASPAFIAVKL